jgi:hypothetical protein
MIDNPSVTAQAKSLIKALSTQINQLQIEISFLSSKKSELDLIKLGLVSKLVCSMIDEIPSSIQNLGILLDYYSLEADIADLKARFTTWKDQIQQIEANPDYQNADKLINSQNGELRLSLITLNQRQNELYKYLKKFNLSVDFQHLLEIIKKRKLNPKRNWIQLLLDVLTGKIYHFNKLKSRILVEFKTLSLKELLVKYKNAELEKLTLSNSISRLQSRITGIEQLKSDYNRLTRQFNNHGLLLKMGIQDNISQYLLSVSDFSKIKLKLAPNFQNPICSLINLSQQISLLDKSVEELTQELNKRQKLQHQAVQIVEKFDESIETSVISWILETLSRTLEISEFRTSEIVDLLHKLADKVKASDGVSFFEVQPFSNFQEIPDLQQIIDQITLSSCTQSNPC